MSIWSPPGWRRTGCAQVIFHRIFPLPAAEARQLGETAHKWRNYLAAGALGPDPFYLLPDFAGAPGRGLRELVDVGLDVWELVDEVFLRHWERWIDPIAANDQDLSAQLTGGLSAQLGETLNLLVESRCGTVPIPTGTPTRSGRKASTTPRREWPSCSGGCRTAPRTPSGTHGRTPRPEGRSGCTGSAITWPRTTWTR
ncbi:hypothetical protein [Nonomuraea typhae]|uniref:hypothetical protein n=1 Tax=Nonomuraea typhae TaxID=2603600 RepID=UPI0012F9635D|nr:hypothetical protein [Nonomuraea typhae]